MYKYLKKKEIEANKMILFNWVLFFLTSNEEFYPVGKVNRENR